MAKRIAVLAVVLSALILPTQPNRVSAESDSPVPITRVAPEVRRVQIAIRVLVGSDGRVQEARIQPHGHRELASLEASVLEAAQQWVFMPVVDRRGKSRASWTTVTMTYQLIF